MGMREKIDNIANTNDEDLLNNYRKLWEIVFINFEIGAKPFPYTYGTFGSLVTVMTTITTEQTSPFHCPGRGLWNLVS